MIENQPLQPLHSIVETKFAVNIALGLGMVAKAAYSLGYVLIRGDDKARLTSGAERTNNSALERYPKHGRSGGAWAL